MVKQVIYTPEVSLDIAEAYDWVQLREPGLGEDFLRCVEAAVMTIQRHPHHGRPAADKFRGSLIRRFPYEVFYEPEPECITVYAVFHCSRDPEKWQQRLRR